MSGTRRYRGRSLQLFLGLRAEICPSESNLSLMWAPDPEFLLNRTPLRRALSAAWHHPTVALEPEPEIERFSPLRLRQTGTSLCLK